MSENKKFFERIKRDKNNPMSFGSACLTIAILSLITVLGQIFIQNGFNIFAYVGYGMSPLILLFNFLPIFLIMLLGYFIFNRIWCGYILINIPLLLLLLVNQFKIFFRDEPLKPIDLALGSEATNIIQNYDLHFRFKEFAVAVLVVAVTVYAIRFLRSAKVKLLYRLCGIVLCVLSLTGLYKFIYSDTDFFNKVSSNANQYYDVSVFNYKGFVFSFLSNINTTVYEVPEGYSEDNVIKILDKYNDNLTDSEDLPNVIAIMSEAFFDPRAGEKTEFYEGMDPLSNYDRLCAEGSYGNIIVPGFAGSTASTEFEYLSGMNISLISESMPSVYKTYINRDCFSLARMFKDFGYDTLALHPGHRWFYNRSTAYEKMGFDNFISVEDLPEDIEKVNYYTADSVTSKLIIDNYKKHLASSNNRYFNFTVTIQNHGPYIDEPTEREPRYVRPEGISDQLYYTINNYMDGLYDADKLLGDVADYISTVDEPTVLVFFGDHLPYFDGAFEGYKYIGYDVGSDSMDGIRNKYSVPYVIWCNEAARKQAEEDGREIKTGKNEDISSNFLASQMLNTIGANPSPYFSFVNELKNEVSVISNAYYTVNGETTNKASLSPEIAEKISEYKILQYHFLKKYYNNIK